MAVDQVNNDPTVLPDTMVNILRVQSWDQKYGPGDNVGGAAVTAVEIASYFPNVLATLGDSSGLSTKYSSILLGLKYADWFATGLISPNHVWFVTNPPYPEDYSGVGEDPRLDSLVGMIYTAPNFQPSSDPNYVRISDDYAALYAEDPFKYQIDYLSWTNSGSYDCAGMILYALDKFLKENPGFTPEQLAEFQDHLNYKAFENSNFSGTALNPIILDSNGDLAA
ncbi:UNVERIFIED_CONTAM: hypothetical protein HDU68_003171, partial [Siphonaria sp. JEL0065]